MKNEETFQPETLSRLEQQILLLVQRREQCRISEVSAAVSVFSDQPQKGLNEQIRRLIDLDYLVRILDHSVLSGKVPDHQLKLSPKGRSTCQQIQDQEKEMLKQERKAAADKRQQNRFQIQLVILGGVIALCAEHIVLPLLKWLWSLIF